MSGEYIKKHFSDLWPRNLFLDELDQNKNLNNFFKFWKFTSPKLKSPKGGENFFVELTLKTLDLDIWDQNKFFKFFMCGEQIFCFTFLKVWMRFLGLPLKWTHTQYVAKFQGFWLEMLRLEVMEVWNLNLWPISWILRKFASLRPHNFGQEHREITGEGAIDSSQWDLSKIYITFCLKMHASKTTGQKPWILQIPEICQKRGRLNSSYSLRAKDLRFFLLNSRYVQLVADRLLFLRFFSGADL
jgi:hypothetical protein